MQAIKTIKGQLVTVTRVEFNNMGKKPWVVMTVILRDGSEIETRSNGEGLVLDIEDAACEPGCPFDALFTQRKGRWAMETE